MRTRRTMFFAAAAAATAALVTGCTGGTSSSSSPPPSTASGSATSAAPAPATTGASPAVVTPPAASTASSAPTASSTPGNTTAGSGTPGCATRDLQATLGISQGTAGSIYQVIDFKNISGAPCTLFGYPGVALAGGSPVTQIGVAATRNSAAGATTVTLSPGDVANALLRVTEAANYPASKCGPTAASFLQIYPPNQTTPIYLAYSATGCTKASAPLLMIGVVQAGSGG